MRVKTFARVRGASPDDGSSSSVNRRQYNRPRGRNMMSCIAVDEESGMVNVVTRSHTHKFAFDGVFNRDAEQEEVYERAIEQVVDGCLVGLNGTVFAYGQTGSGKTYSVTGGATYETRGCVPRALSKIFEQQQVSRCRVSYVEVYNEEVFDLLNGRKKVNMFAVRSNGGTAIHLKELTVSDVGSEEEALDLFFSGNMQRSTGSTTLNMSSSRSHCIFAIEVETMTHVARLNFVDLAGSEKTHDTTSKHINLSLHYLEQVVLDLQGQQKHVGFRNSTMTSLLRESLIGNCQTVFLITLNPDPSHVMETLSSCRFAQRCRSISTNVVANETMEQRVERLEHENHALRHDLEIALDALQEHDKVREMLNELLSHMDQDAVAMISSETSFRNFMDVTVDIEEEIIIATNAKTCRSVQIPKQQVLAMERTRMDDGTPIFRLYGFPMRRPRSWSAPYQRRTVNPEVLLELEYLNDGSRDAVEQATWIQSLEHWLSPDVDDLSADLRVEPQQKATKQEQHRHKINQERFLSETKHAEDEAKPHLNRHTIAEALLSPLSSPKAVQLKKSFNSTGIIKRAISAFKAKSQSTVN